MLNPDNRPDLVELCKHRFIAGREPHPRDAAKATAKGSPAHVPQVAAPAP